MRVLLQRFFRLWPLFAVILILVAALASSQTPRQRPTAITTIDGSITPDKIPDWVLWDRLFKISAMLSDQSPDNGQQLWSRLNLTTGQTAQLLSTATALSSINIELDNEAKALVTSTENRLPELRHTELHQIRKSQESLVLEHREHLKEVIGDEAMQRLYSFARLHIAPTIKMGTIINNR